MKYFKRVRSQKLYRKPSFWVSWVFLIVLLGSLTSFVLYFPVSWYLNTFHSSTRVCTVESAELISDSSGTGGPTPTTSVRVDSSDCGRITITDVNYPHGISKARLAEQLDQHRGEKFEFVIDFMKYTNTLGSQGVTSLSPVDE